jgi:broad specificity phosphatase PhoE
MASKRRTITLAVIRCGETTWDVEGRLHGRSDLPLSIDGRTAVSEDVASFGGGRIAAIYHPPDDAAIETAQIVAAEAGAKAKAVPELADPDLGVLEGLTAKDFADRFSKRFKQWQEDPLTLTPPEGEPLIDARARLFGAISRLARRSRADEVGIVLHPVGLGLLRCWLADRPAADLWSLVRTRPRIERYLLGVDLVRELAEIANAEYQAS